MSALTPDETILGLIALQTCHGYELVEIFTSSSELGDIWKMSTSQIYSVLKRLEKQKLVVGQVVESENAPNRIEYSLTPDGTERLESWLLDPEPSASVRRIRVEFLSRLYIARRLNIPTSPIVVRQRKACDLEREHLLKQLETKAPGVSYLANEFVIAQLDAILNWIHRCELMPKYMDDMEE